MTLKTFETACGNLGYKVEDLEKKKARMFPVNKCKLTDEQNTTNVFLSCLIGIKEFREALFQGIGINSITNKTANLHAYTEIAAKTDDDRPDGLIFLTTGRAKAVDKSFFLEVKTKSQLETSQIERYLTKCKDCKIDCLITISNDFVTTPENTPLKDLKNRKNSKDDLKMFHFSWKYIATILTNVILNGIEDEDQIYLAKELLYFLDNHPDILNFSSMHKEWKEDVQEIINADKLLPKSKFKDILDRITTSWIQEEKDIGLILQKNSNKEIKIFLSRDEKTKLNQRFLNKKQEIEDKQKLTTTFLVKDIKDNHFNNGNKLFNIELNFRNTKFRTEINIPAKSGKIIKQINDIINLLEKKQVGEEDKTIIAPILKGNKEIGQVSFKDLREKKDLDKKPYELFKISSKSEEVKYFLIYMDLDITKKSFYSRTKIIEEIEEITKVFFNNIIEPLC